MRARKERKQPTILTLDTITTWEVDGPEFIAELPPNSYEVLYQPKPDINSKVSLLCQGVNTNIKVDAIVCPSNIHLIPGGGINGAIFAAAGNRLVKECTEVGHCGPGCAVKTNGYNLPAKYVIHAVGPMGGDKPMLLAQTYNSILSYIDGKNIRSIALCCISSGLYGFPADNAATIALQTVRTYLEKPHNLKKVDRIVFFVFTPEDSHVYLSLFPSYFPLVENYYQEEEVVYDNNNDNNY